MRVVLFFLLIVSITSCKQSVQEYKKISDDIAYKKHQFDEGRSIKNAHTLCLLMNVTNEAKDTLHYVPHYPYFVVLEDNKLHQALRTHHIGDSISYRLERSFVNQYFSFYQLLQEDTGVVYLNFRIVDAFTIDSAAIKMKQLLSKREIDEQAALKRFIQEQEGFEQIEHIYRKITKKTNGNPLRFGDELSIHYKGRFLNGYEFDNTYEKEIVPTFNYGQDFQLIEGLHLGLVGMREGESVKIILPSQRAFGEQGSLAGIVPPYTAVIFEVELIKIRN